MKNLKVFLIAVLLVLSLSSQSYAQTAVTRTTLSSAVSAGAAVNQVIVASATGISASTASTQNYILVDKELMLVAAVSSTTLTVRRAQSGSAAVGHISGAQVVYGPGGGFSPNTGNVYGVFMGGSQMLPTGSCTRTSQPYLPVFAITGNITNSATFDCLGGKWVSGTLPDSPDATPITLACNVPIGSVAYGSFGTNTTDAIQEWLTSIWVPKTAWVTGIKVLCGATCTTDNILGILRDSTGNKIANAATAGVLLATADSFQTQAFTAAQFVVGPAKYYIGVQGNGTTAGSLRTLAASTFNDVAAGSVTATFGTVAASVTVPTTFTATKGPVSCLYY